MKIYLKPYTACTKVETEDYLLIGSPTGDPGRIGQGAKPSMRFFNENSKGWDDEDDNNNSINPSVPTKSHSSLEDED